MGKRVMMIGLDGADPFVIKRLISEGRLPNIKKAIENGVVGENMAMIGAFPSVTPPNWASLATGNWPKAHGVTCFFNHTLGNELDLFGMNWDAQRVESELIWEKYAEEGKTCLMLNYCEAWPPRDAAKDNCVFIDGSGVVPFLRCQGGFQKEIILEEGDFPLKEIPHYVEKGAGDCVVYGDAFDEMVKESSGYSAERAARVSSPINLPTVDTRMPAAGPEKFPSYEELMKTGDSMGDAAIADRMFSALKEPTGFGFELPEGAKAASIMVNNGLLRRFFVVTASDGVHYDTVTLYEGRKTEKVMGQAKVGEWSNYIFDTFNLNDKKEPMVYRFRVIEMDPEGKKVKIYLSHQIKASGYKDYCYPADVWERMYPEVGPMVPFGKFDLIDHECLETTIESWDNLYKWHEDAADWMFKNYPDWQLFYTHVHGIDEFNHWFIHKSIEGSNDDYKHYAELINRMYEINDRYVGKLMEQMDDGNTAIFITSDHAAVPHSAGTTNPGIGSLGGIQTPVMEELGLTKSFVDEKSGLRFIKWDETVAVAQRSSYIYINLKGRDPQGIVEPEDYEKTVQMVIDKLYNYRHPVTGERIISFCLTRDEMAMVGMGGNHVGDILYQVVPKYCNEHAFAPSTTTNEGYSLNNLCIMSGAGFKQGVEINRTVRIVDVVPTICHLGEVPMVSNVEGGVIWQALEGFEEKSYK